MRWEDIEADPRMLAALVHAGARPEMGSQDDKRAWSERFANGCAIAVADELRGARLLRDKAIRPKSLKDGTEPLTPLGAGTSKRIDVTVADAVLGLEIGVSLKGHNFKDVRTLNYDKNLTGRLYELADEMRLVHEHLPHAFMVGLLFFPIDSTVDKRSEQSESSFARGVMKLRERTGRLDPALGAHAGRCDAGYVGLYVPEEQAGPFRAGATRFVDVRVDPPRRGRPRIADTLPLAEMVGEIVSQATFSERARWAEPEPDG